MEINYSFSVLVWLGVLALCPIVFSQTNKGADIVFVVDGSDRVGTANFDKFKTWMKQMVEFWDIGVDKNRVGLVTYGNGAHMGFTLLQGATNYRQVISEINTISYPGGTSDAADALKMATGQAFQVINGGRSDRPQIVIHLATGSDGLDPQALVSEVSSATSSGVKVYTVGVGSGWTGTMLRESSSLPSSRYAMSAKTFDELPSIMDTLLQRVESEVPSSDAALPAVPVGCQNKADIVLVVDGSYSVTSANFQKMKEQLKQLAVKLPISQDGVHMGMMQYSGKNSLEFPLSMYKDRLTVMQAIDNVNYLGGGTRTGNAIKYMTDQMFTRNMGARDGVPRIGIVITDGTSADVQDSITQANLARANGIDLLVVGVGSNVNQQELVGIAGGQANHVYHATGFDTIGDQIASILRGTCDATGTIPPATQDPYTGLTETCFDKITNCQAYIDAYAKIPGGFCNTTNGLPQDSCPYTCGICTTTIPVTEAPCVDKDANCASYDIADCKDPAYLTFFQEHCRMYCGLCPTTAEMTGFNGNCMYDGKKYAQGAKWNDGCDYECVCTDAAHGKFECTSKCDVYYNLPAECTLVKKDGECCLQPVCNFKSNVTQSVVSQVVSYNGQNYCNYKNQRYSQNEYFEDGCDKKCTCIDASTGRMQCSSYCPTYDMSALPSYCFLEKVPGQCCSAPRCEFPTTTGSFTGQGTITGQGLSKTYWDPAMQPTCLDLDPQCILYDQASCTEKDFRSYMVENCPVTCNACNEKYAPPTPGPSDFCLYDGQQYVEGDTWEPDCAHQCVCDSQLYSYYRCTSKCPNYQNIPSGCHVQTQPGQCCPQIMCPSSQVIVPSTTNILTSVGGNGIMVGNKPIMPHFLANGTLDPNNPGVQRPSIKGCLFNGQLLVQGQSATGDHCGDVCSCTNENTGSMTCYQRCPVYQGVDVRCTMVPDTNDACCQVPNCPPGVHQPQGVYGIPKPVVSIVEMPDPSSLVPGYVTVAPTTTNLGPAYTTFPPGMEPPTYVQPPTMPPNPVHVTHECGNAPADIHFLLDVSGSLETANFLKQLDFVKNFARSFTIDPNHAQIGITTFSTQPHPQFWMNTHTSNAALLAAIDKIQYPYGDTRTDLGLDFVRQNAFTKPHGDRDNARNILIVITDGQSTRPDLTRVSANNIHQGNLNIYAVGVGDHIQKSELELIASDPSNVYTVQNYDSLDQIQSILHKTSCDGTCFFNFTGNSYKEGERWQYNCEYNCLCIDGYAGKYICKDMCKKFVCPAGFQCQETPDPDYPCCKLMPVIGPLPTVAQQIPLTNFTPPCVPHSFQPPPVMPPTSGPKPTKDCGTNPADIHFLLDASGSVGLLDFQKQLDFVKQFASSFNIGPNSVQIGATIFSSNPSNVFWMNDHPIKADLLAAIDNIPYPGGGTRTDLGLDFIRNNAFIPAHGDRPNANNILIVITDGQSNQPALTQVAANSIHQGNLNIFAIGVGSQITQSELQQIASDPSNVYTVNNFDALDSVQHALQQTTCEGTCYYNKTGQNFKEGESWQDGPINCLCMDGNTGHYDCKHICKQFVCPAGFHCTEYPDPNFPFCNLMNINPQSYPASCPANVTSNFSPGCEPITYNPPPTMTGVTAAPITDCGTSPADIHFLLDSSGSVGSGNYQKQLDFVKQFANSFTIGPNAVQVGVTIFSTGVDNQFWMNDHTTNADLVAAIGSIPYQAGSTHTDAGLDFVRQNAFTKAHGDRDNVNNILIVITDGQSTDAPATKVSADNLHKTNINVFAIGVGKGASDAELKLIASDPTNVYTVNNFDALQTLEAALKNTTCEGSCHYNVTGKNHKTGESWNNGCVENCICLDGNSGNYQCKPVCKHLTCPQGYQCTEYPDPHFPCCNLLRMHMPPLPPGCDGGNPGTTTPMPTTPPTTPAPTEYAPGCVPQSYNAPTVYTVNNTNQQTDCGDNPADIHFLLDSSGSVGSTNFRKQLDFIKQFASSFNISSTGVRIGVTTFDSTVHQQFWMNDHMNENDLKAAISHISFTGSATRTDLGLKFVRDNAFTKAHGDRDNVNNILIVVTDGGSNQPALTKAEAEELHKGNINVLSVGVGSGIKVDELKLIATDPSNVYTVNNFDALSNIESALKKTACEGSCHFTETGTNYKEGDKWQYGCNLNCVCLDGKTGSYRCEDRCKQLPRCPSGYHCTKFQDPNNPCCSTMKIELPTLSPSCPANVTANFQPGCEPFSYFPVPTMPGGVTPAPITDCGSMPADIHFLIDASGSVGSSNFQKQLDFVEKFANSFNISSSAVRVGVTTFDSSVHQQFWMNDHMDKASLISAIGAVPYPGGGTQTDIALDYVAQNAFTKPHGDRDNVNNILIILTDGKSASFDKTRASSIALHQKNMNVFSIGVGSGVNQRELELMASDPANVFNVNNFDALNSIEAGLKKTACEGSCHFDKTGQNYKTGEYWRDGCDKNCLCIDGNKGQYVCDDVCKPMSSCPAGYNCTQVTDPNNVCCDVLQIDLPTIPDDCPKPPPLVNPYTPGCAPLTYVAPPVMPTTHSATTDCGLDYQADIHFLLDSSGSVGVPNYQKQLDFVKQFANSFTIGPSDVQIGVTTFSTTPNNQFWMNTHLDKNALIAAIDQIPYQTGNTHTDLGLDFIRQNAFTKAHGDRDNVNNILIVITDGQSTEPTKTKVSADDIHKENINIFAIGVGSSINRDELELIGSTKQNVYTVSNFDALQGIQAALQKTTCEGTCFFNVTGKKYKEGERWQHGCNLNCLCTDGSSGHYICNDVCKPVPACPAGFQCTQYPDPNYPCCKLQRISMRTPPASCPAPSPTTATNIFQTYTQGCQPASYVAPPVMPGGTTSAPITDCGSNPADIHFLIDSSGSVQASNFQKQLDFVKQFANSFNISSSAVRLGVTTFSSVQHQQFWMNEHMTKPDLLNAISNIPYDTGNTHTELGLKWVRENAFTTAHGARPGVKNILIIMTDGQSTVPSQTKIEADLIHKENIDIFSIGVGQGVAQNELQYMASSSQNVYTVNNFNVLSSIEAALKKTACEGTCHYNTTGKNYKSGESWRDGCNKNCLCVDGNAGRYICHDVCQHFTCPAGYNCTEIPDPDEPCCKLLKIQEPPAPTCIPPAPIIDFTPNQAPPSFNPLPPWPPITGTRPPTNATCTAPLDLLFLVDKSASIKPDQWVKEKQFVEEMIKKFQIGPNDVQVGLALFANFANHTKWCFNDFTTQAQLVQATQALDCPECFKGKTATAHALQHAREEMLFNATCGARSHVPKIVVVLTDGHSTEKPYSYVEDQARLMQATGAQVITIGVGNYGLKELQLIASDNSLVFTANNFTNLLPILDSVTSKTCQVGSNCVFNVTGKSYAEGERWRYGCEYNCLCTDGVTGSYVCTDVCKRFSCPAGYTCTEYPDPDYPCCKLLKVHPLRLDDVRIDYCTDTDGQKHSEGSVWLPSCAEKCVCVDASTNHISCSNRCPQYYNLPPDNTCTYIEDPSDPCCKIPICHAKNNATANPHGLIEIPGGGYEATAAPGINYCVYNGHNYKQDDEWFRGCDFKCTCVDQSKGKQTCVPRCTRYDTSRLPPMCQLVTDPADTCCQTPICITNSSANYISGTKGPSIPPLYQTLGPNSINGSAYPRCESKGNFYYQGNQWFEGCDRKCRCEDAVNNVQICEDRCPTIRPQKGCVIVTDPNDVCCQKKDCKISPTLFNFTGNIPTGMIPTLSPDFFIGGPAPPTPDPQGVIPPQVAVNKCVFKGQNYKQGDTWNDGCDLQCMCTDETSGQYKCTTRCTRYPDVLPSQCRLFKIPGEPCCQELDCSLNPQPNIGSPTTAPGVPTLPNNVPLLPNIPQQDMCQDNNNYYTVGQSWYVGCDLKCFCAKDGIKQCQSRCRSYPAPPAGTTCTLKPDPADSACCTIPDCHSTGPTAPPPTGPHVLPSIAPPGIFVGIGATDVPPTRDPNDPNGPDPTSTPKCVYKNIHYDEGATWKDGCIATCTCLDAAKGKYSCVDVCPRYPTPPPGCYLTRDHNNPCCQIPFCPDDPANLNPTDIYTGHTLRPPYDPNQISTSKCEYNGVKYNQGETWDDGCDYRCTCDDAVHGYIRCERMCPEYKNLGSGCVFITDESNSCCRRPICPAIVPSVRPTGSDGKTLYPPIPTGPDGHPLYSPVPTDFYGNTVNPPVPVDSNGKTLHPPVVPPTGSHGHTLRPPVLIDNLGRTLNPPVVLPTGPDGHTLYPPVVIGPDGKTMYPPVVPPTDTSGHTLYPPVPIGPQGTLYPPVVPPTDTSGNTLRPPVPIGDNGKTLYPPVVPPTRPDGHTRFPPAYIGPDGKTIYPPVVPPTGPSGNTLYPPVPIGTDGKTMYPPVIVVPPTDSTGNTVYPPVPIGTDGKTMYPPVVPPTDTSGNTVYPPVPIGTDGNTMYPPVIPPTRPDGNTLYPPVYIGTDGKTLFPPVVPPTGPSGNTLFPPVPIGTDGKTMYPPVTIVPPTGQAYAPVPIDNNGKTLHPPVIPPTAPSGNTLYPPVVIGTDGKTVYPPVVPPTRPDGNTKYPPVPIGTDGKTLYPPIVPPTGPSGKTLYPPVPIGKDGNTMYPPVVPPTGSNGKTLYPPVPVGPHGKTLYPPSPTDPVGRTIYPQGFPPTGPSGNTLYPPAPTGPGGNTLYPPVPIGPHGKTLIPPVVPPTGPDGNTLYPYIPVGPDGKTLYPPVAPPTGPDGHTVYPPVPIGTDGKTLYPPQIPPTLPGGKTMYPPVPVGTDGKTLYPPVIPPTGPDGHTKYPPVPVDWSGNTLHPPVIPPTGPDGHTLYPFVPVGVDGKTLYPPQIPPTLPGGKTMYPPIPVGTDGKTLHPPVIPPTGPDGHTVYPPIPVGTDGKTLHPPVIPPTGPDGHTIYPPVPVDIDGKTVHPPVIPPTGPDGHLLYPPVPVDIDGNTLYPPQIPPTLPGGNTMYPPIPVGTDGKTLHPPIVPPTSSDGKTLYPFVHVGTDGKTIHPPVVAPTGPDGNTIYPPIPVDIYGKTIHPPVVAPTGPDGRTLYPPVPIGPDGKTLYPPHIPPTGPSGNTVYAPVPVGPDGKTLYPPVVIPTDPYGQTLYPPVFVDPTSGQTLYPPQVPPTGLNPTAAPTGPDGHTLQHTPSVLIPIPTAAPKVIVGQRVDPPGTDPNKPKKCEFKGQSYDTSDTWTDGACGMKCTCLDEVNGRYQCVDRCPAYKASDMPYYCQLQTDPDDQCCLKPVCTEPVTPTPAGQTTDPLVPTYQVPFTSTDRCVYQNHVYLNGQVWNDGCSKTCKCVAVGQQMSAVCTDRCPTYAALPDGCSLVPDPNDIDCCQVASCVPFVGPDGRITTTMAPGLSPGATASPNATYPPPFVVTNPPQVHYGRLPTQSTGDTGLVKKRCIYDGREYTTGQSWRDGCEKQCQCLDQDEGLYKCTDLCTKYTSVPLQCSLHRDPNNLCCQVMTCDPQKVVTLGFETITPPTQGVPGTVGSTTTPDPNAPVTPRPVPTVYTPNGTFTVPTSHRPVADFCVYNGAPFLQGQTFNRNCQQKCKCDDAKNNVINCFDRCPIYPELSSDCTLEVDPQDPCCRVKYCVNVPDVVSVVTPSPKPTIFPQYVTPTPVKIPQPVVIPGGTITGENHISQPGLDNVCVYNGQNYGRAATWKDGCGVTCTCLDPTTNQFSCTDRCNKFDKVPSNCFISKDKDNCCDVATCYDPAMVNTAQPPVTQIGGVTIKPDVIPTRTTGDVCQYDGKTFTEGQVYLDDACNNRCVCEDAANNYMRCVPRCKQYSASPSCELVPDPSDPQCCHIPKCHVQDPLNPTGVTGSISVVATPPTTPHTTMSTSYPNQPTPSAAVPQEGCYFQKHVYSQGEKWQDSCSQCECVDAKSSRYRCVSMCPDYPDLPTHCTMVYDNLNPCCMKPHCVLPPTTQPGQTTLIPVPIDVCVDQGVAHKQGESWDQGCTDIFTCEDAASNSISRRDRCPKLQPPQTGCQLETDPKDACCQILTCDNPDTSDPTKVLTGVIGTITGSGKPPQSHNPLVPQTLGCYVNHHVYRQGQTWTDGCSFICRCDDDATGQFSCDQRCPSLPNLPSTCSLTPDPMDSCCQVASCTPPKDLLPDLVNVTPDPLHPNATVQMLVPSVKGVCLYKGQYLRPGQVFYNDQCGQVCTCENATSNLVRCRDLCASVTAGAGCTLIPDPANPTCCKVEECPLPPTYVPPTGPDYLRPPVKPQVIHGSPVPPLMVNGSKPVTDYNGCHYNGQTYPKGAKWEDRCDFYCECLNSTTGQYKCNQRCPTLLPQAECVVVEDPNDPCCHTLFCDFVNPEPFPSGLPPHIKVIQPLHPATKSPYVYNGVPTISMVTQNPTDVSIGFCFYGGAQYLQSQSWNVKCDQKCTCLNATSGVYSCVDRCPSFNPAPGCQMRTSPTDPCCLVQDCAPSYTDPVFQVTVNPNVTSPTYAPSFLKPGEVVIKPGNPATFIKVINTPVIPGGSPELIRVQNTKCIAENGHFYGQGESWDTSNAHCTCIDAAINKAQCTQKCGNYYFLPSGCHLETDPHNPPCRVAVCPAVSIQTPVPMTFGPPVITLSTIPQSAVTPPLNPKCHYKDGKSYMTNEEWTDGCQLCKCVDPSNNNYQCTRTCPAFKDLPSYCVMVSSPADPCCQTVNCTKDGVSLTPLIVDPVTHVGPPLDPSKTNLIPILSHPVTTGHGNPIGVSPSVLRQYGGRNACVFKGQLYRPGDSWDDGCEKSCTCEHNAQGMYTCVQICGLQPPIPSYCRQVHIPGQCCNTITCDIPKVGQYVPSSSITQLLPGVIPQLTPGQSNLTILPNAVVQSNAIVVPGGGYPVTWLQIQKISDRCVKDGKAYMQGETWNEEGCEVTCECIEAATGFYQCKHNCPIYDNLREGCVLSVNPGQCCRRILCNDRDTGKTFDPILHPQDGYIIYGRYPEGTSGFRPYYVPSGVSSSFIGCYFNNKVYTEGQSWQDSCTQQCTCVDGQRHIMQCKSMCYRFDNIPSQCKLVASSSHCCQEVQCPTDQYLLTPKPHIGPYTNLTEEYCINTIPDCDQYTHMSCGPTYHTWANKYCPEFCGLCPNKPLAMPECRDKFSHCNLMARSECQSSENKGWMYDNCYKTCGYCNNCADIADTCDQFDFVKCNGLYKPWAQQMCASTCGFCGQTTSSPGGNIIPGGNGSVIGQFNNVTGYNNYTSMSSWLLLMKGVANVTGDLYSLWTHQGGLNQNNPMAVQLTANYPGHYKSYLADNFGSCNFEKIRVSIWNKGIERGYIIFNAQGATKQNIFDPSRIITSTWSDIRTQSVFALPQDSITGREFSFGQSGSSCTGQGWMYVSTSKNCSYATGSNTFYFSPTTGAVTFDQMIQGDVIAIMAQGGSCGSGQSTASPPILSCMWLNQNHSIGSTWNDTCNIECECLLVNNTKPAVRCKDKCPTYNLPANCKMEKVPGECCKKPVCTGCLDSVDQSIVHAVNETWRIGCESDCTCHKGGQVTCNKVCLEFNLPPSIKDQCTFPTPCPGKCCAMPDCGAGIQFNIPQEHQHDYC